MKIKTVYVCSNCGETSPRWMGRCPSCGSWNTMNEDVVAEAPKAGLSGGKTAAAAPKFFEVFLILFLKKEENYSSLARNCCT